MKNRYTKRQHYVPKMLLKKWSFDGKFLNCFNKAKQEYAAICINNVCVENDLYELKDSNEKYINRNYLEDKMAEMECAFTDYLEDLEEKILSQAQSSQYIPLSKKEIFSIIYWLAFLASRNPKTTKKLKAVANQFNIDYTESLYDLLIDSVLNYPLSFAAKNIDKVSLEFYVSGEAAFAASDSLVDLDFGNINQVVPLSPKLAVKVCLLEEEQNNICKVEILNKKQIDKVNYRIADGAERFIFFSANFQNV